MATTLEIGRKLVELCRQGRDDEAVSTLYAPDIVSVEARDGPKTSARIEGLTAVKGKKTWWVENHEVHKTDVRGPWPNGDRFIVRFTYDVTAKAGPMAGKRMTVDEAALYTVKNGRVVQEEFFYDMGG